MLFRSPAISFLDELMNGKAVFAGDPPGRSRRTTRFRSLYLIMIGVALDTMNKVESQLKMHNYEGFFK